MAKAALFRHSIYYKTTLAWYRIRRNVLGTGCVMHDLRSFVEMMLFHTCCDLLA